MTVMDGFEVEALEQIKLEDADKLYIDYECSEHGFTWQEGLVDWANWVVYEYNQERRRTHPLFIHVVETMVGVPDLQPLRNWLKNSISLESLNELLTNSYTNRLGHLYLRDIAENFLGYTSQLHLKIVHHLIYCELCNRLGEIDGGFTV